MSTGGVSRKRLRALVARCGAVLAFAAVHAGDASDFDELIASGALRVH